MSIQIGVCQAEYTTNDNTPILHIFGRDNDGVPHRVDITGFRPYFYVPVDVAKECADINGIEIDTSVTYNSIKGELLYRVWVDNPRDVYQYRDVLCGYEADLNYPVRFLIDNKIKSGLTVPSHCVDISEVEPCDMMNPMRFMVVDIECYSENKFPQAEDDPIISVTCYDSFTETYVTFFLQSPDGVKFDIKAARKKTDSTEGCYIKGKHEVFVYHDEVSLLRALCEYIQTVDPDILTGWNFNEFDIPYIVKRLIVNGIQPATLCRIPTSVMPRWFNDYMDYIHIQDEDDITPEKVAAAKTLLEVSRERVRIKGRSIFDLLDGYKRLQQSQKASYRLDAIAEEELGERKVRYTGTIGELWKNDPIRFIDYNYQDVRLCVRINKHSDIIGFFSTFARYVGCSIEQTTISSIMVDTYLLRFTNGKYVLPSKGSAMGEEDQEFEGAVVLEPSVGLREDVIVLDLKSLYPMVMYSLNISPEMKSENGEIVAPNGIRFMKSPDGVTRSLIGELLAERDKLKTLRNTFTSDSNEYHVYDLQQSSVKIVMNTYYGVSGFKKFRLYDPDTGAAVTSSGRAIIAHCKQVVQDMGYETIYGDTDSVMVELKVDGDMEKVMEIGKKLEKALNESFDEFAKRTFNIETHTFSIKFEKYYRRFLQTGKKKRYAGHLVWKEGVAQDKIDITGFEAKRSDTPHIVKEVQSELLERLVKGVPIPDVKKYLRKVIGNYQKGNFSLDEVGIPRGISKALTAYKGADAHIRGATYANTYLNANFGQGSKPKRVYISHVTGKYPQTDVLCFEYGSDVPPEFHIDWDVMFEKTLKSPLERIIEPLGWNFAEIDPRVTTLDMYGC